ncbi:MAG: hypothetical protein K2J65_11085 [Duncaniella sp.]|nr:hypothetical protein [Duncaniella sp.]
MKKTITAETITLAYRLLGNASLSKMEDAEKFTVIKAMRKLKPIATPLSEAVETAREKLVPEDYARIRQNALRYEQLTVEEQMEVSTVERELDEKVSECVKEEALKEHELEYDALSEAAFGRFLSSNDFKLATIMVLSDVLCE